MAKLPTFAKISMLIFAATSTMMSFQNCAPGFQALDAQGELASTAFSTIPVTCTLPEGTQLTPGNSVTGFAMMSAAYPVTCGAQVQRTCLSTGAFDGVVPVYTSCTQQCRHPDNNQIVNAGSQYVYFTRSNGATQAECDAARVTTSCQQASGLFSPTVPAQRFASCLVAGQTCAYTNSTGTALPTGNMTGSTVTGFAMPSATSPALCGASVTRTCQATGQWTGAVPVYTSCTQKCLHPDSNQPVDAGTQYAFYTKSSGTTAECTAARVVSSCQQSSGAFAPAVVQTRYSTCQIQDVPDRVTHEMLVGDDTRFNVFKTSCVGCHSNTTALGGLNLLSATQSRDKANLILSRMKHTNTGLQTMPPSGTITDAFKMAVVEKWVSLGAPADAFNTPTPPPVTQPPPPTPPANLALTCVPQSAIPKVAMKRLSRLQYTNALMELLNSGGYLSWSTAHNTSYSLQGKLAPLMNTIPDDNAEKFTFTSIDQTTTQDHFFAYIVVSSAIADQISKDANWLNGSSKVSCLITIASNTQPGDACIRSFIKKFGQKALRKKIELTEENEYLALYKSGSSAQDGLATLIQAFLTSPRFLNIVELDGKVSASNASLLELNDFELAQRLSFHFLGSIPSDAMMDAAAAGLYTSSEASYQTEVSKVLQVERNPAAPNLMIDTWRSHEAELSNLQKNYHRFYREWLEVEKMPEITESGLISTIDMMYGPTRNYGNGNVSGPIQDALKNETYNFAHRMSWVENKSFYDLMMDRSIVTNGHTRGFYYIPEPPTTYAYGHAQQTMVDHTGLLTRAVTTLRDGATDDTHPFLRGAFIRRKILCDVLPSPNPDALPDRALASGDILLDSKRLQYEAKVKATECAGCHAQINPVGFALDDFDSLSRFRGGKFEPVFKTELEANGSLKYVHAKNVPVNAAVTDLNIDKTTGESSNGGIQFSDMIGKSYKGNMCFTRQVFRHTMGRFESAQDACMLNEMYNKLREQGGGIEKMILQMPYSKDFKMKRIGG